MHSDHHASRVPRIVFVDHSGLPGGGQLGLARFLKGTRLQNVHVVLMGPGPAFEDVRVSRGTPVETINTSSGPLALLATRSRLRRRLNELQPDLIVANSNRSALVLASIARRRRGVRVYYMRDDLNPTRKSIAKRMLLGQWMMRQYDAIIANSRWTASTIPIARLRESSEVAYPVSGVEPSPRRQLIRRDAPLRILSLSRIAEWKGIHVLLGAAAILEQRGLARQFTLTVAGASTHEDPEYEVRMRELAARLDTDVSFPGHVNDTEALLKNHDVLVACSTSPEPFGQVIVQGLAHGLVTIASQEGGPVELIRNGVNGYLIPPGSETKLADLLEDLVRNTEVREQTSEAAIKSALAYSDSITIDALDGMLERQSRQTAKT